MFSSAGLLLLGHPAASLFTPLSEGTMVETHVRPRVTREGKSHVIKTGRPGKVSRGDR